MEYQFPNISLFNKHQFSKPISEEEIALEKHNLVKTLDIFDIKIEKIRSIVGPTTILYEFLPVSGTKIVQFKNLETDISMALSVPGVRIITPIPGRNTIGIEIPLKNPNTTYTSELISSENFKKHSGELPVVLGKNIFNETIVGDLTKMPHLLIAGATGQGKSVQLNSMLVSLLYKKSPEDLRFVLIDPKKVELSIYNGLSSQYVLNPLNLKESTITNSADVVKVLGFLCKEMDTRYDLLKNNQVRNIKEYNQKSKTKIPYLITIIDEFADLVMGENGKEIEKYIVRIAQLARAIGIHLVIATQRPSVDVITGLIKANFPARIAFKTFSKTDSRTILDYKGAEQLVGNGDMLFSMNNSITRLQGGYIGVEEIERIVKFIKEKNLGFEFVSTQPQNLDPKVQEAIEILKQTPHISKTDLQIKLKVGYFKMKEISDFLLNC